jgi:hypothetical protein
MHLINPKDRCGAFGLHPPAIHQRLSVNEVLRNFAVGTIGCDHEHHPMTLGVGSGH